MNTPEFIMKYIIEQLNVFYKITVDNFCSAILTF